MAITRAAVHYRGLARTLAVVSVAAMLGSDPAWAGKTDYEAEMMRIASPQMQDAISAERSRLRREPGTPMLGMEKNLERAYIGASAAFLESQERLSTLDKQIEKQRELRDAAKKNTVGFIAGLRRGTARQAGKELVASLDQKLNELEESRARFDEENKYYKNYYNQIAPLAKAAYSAGMDFKDVRDSIPPFTPIGIGGIGARARLSPDEGSDLNPTGPIWHGSLERMEREKAEQEENPIETCEGALYVRDRHSLDLGGLLKPKFEGVKRTFQSHLDAEDNAFLIDMRGRAIVQTEQDPVRDSIVRMADEILSTPNRYHASAVAMVRAARLEQKALRDNYKGAYRSFAECITKVLGPKTTAGAPVQESVFGLANQCADRLKLADGGRIQFAGMGKPFEPLQKEEIEALESIEFLKDASGSFDRVIHLLQNESDPNHQRHSKSVVLMLRGLILSQENKSNSRQRLESFAECIAQGINADLNHHTGDACAFRPRVTTSSLDRTTEDSRSIADSLLADMTGSLGSFGRGGGDSGTTSRRAPPPPPSTSTADAGGDSGRSPPVLSSVSSLHPEEADALASRSRGSAGGGGNEGSNRRSSAYSGSNPLVTSSGNSPSASRRSSDASDEDSSSESVLHDVYPASAGGKSIRLPMGALKEQRIGKRKMQPDEIVKVAQLTLPTGAKDKDVVVADDGKSYSRFEIIAARAAVCEAAKGKDGQHPAFCLATGDMPWKTNQPAAVPAPAKAPAVTAPAKAPAAQTQESTGLSTGVESALKAMAAPPARRSTGDAPYVYEDPRLLGRPGSSTPSQQQARAEGKSNFSPFIVVKSLSSSSESSSASSSASSSSSSRSARTPPESSSSGSSSRSKGAVASGAAPAVGAPKPFRLLRAEVRIANVNPYLSLDEMKAVLNAGEYTDKTQQKIYRLTNEDKVAIKNVYCQHVPTDPLCKSP